MYSSYIPCIPFVFQSVLFQAQLDFYFPDRGSLGMGQKFDFGILDVHVLRSTESKKVVFTKWLSSVRANKNGSYGSI